MYFSILKYNIKIEASEIKCNNRLLHEAFCYVKMFSIEGKPENSNPGYTHICFMRELHKNKLRTCYLFFLRLIIV